MPMAHMGVGATSWLMPSTLAGGAAEVKLRPPPAYWTVWISTRDA
jgi:hypothetical protein